ncbi:zinc-binding dehydrogenase [Burkholderia sp.]|jgi:NADPH:quinone reductase-like Zn-dependent oxidoreductase|uniref:zinc-binding dehydrogenase n=1 Tax=Burkholderia sp. TaxID=36773 RepID=UPI00258BF72C|nr:zinc-binding dehydrogenase [Burkholderia sp.]
MTRSNHQASLPARYQAWTWQGCEHPEQLRLEQRPMPVLKRGQVLVRNDAIGLNPVDWKVLGGALVNWHPGHVPGVDGAGTVVAVADDAMCHLLGRRVAYHQALGEHGSFAEYTPIAASVLLTVPESLDFETAASVPCPALTAWQALEKVPCRVSTEILVSGAGGAVGNYLVQLAAERGFVVSASSHERHWERLRERGASRFLTGPGDEAIGATHELARRFHAVFDSVDAQHAARWAPAVAANGHIVCIQGRFDAPPLPPFTSSVSLHEVALNALHTYGDDAAWLETTAAGSMLLACIANGRMQPEARVIGDFDTLPVQLEGLKQRQFSGKPVVRVG